MNQEHNELHEVKNLIIFLILLWTGFQALAIHDINAQLKWQESEDRLVMTIKGKPVRYRLFQLRSYGNSGNAFVPVYISEKHYNGYVRKMARKKMAECRLKNENSKRSKVIEEIYDTRPFPVVKRPKVNWENVANLSRRTG